MSISKDGMVAIHGSKLDILTSLERRISPEGGPSVDCLQPLQSFFVRNQKEKVDNAGERASLSKTPRDSGNHPPKSCLDLLAHPEYYDLDGTRVDANGEQFESSLFSSSFSELFSRKLRVHNKDIESHQPVKIVPSYHELGEPFEFDEEIEAQTIGHLLPDEDDFFAGVIDRSGNNPLGKNGDDFEDFDLFSSVGGMELEVNDHAGAGKSTGGLLNAQEESNRSVVGESASADNTSRTIIVRNINSHIEDSDLKALFQQYGDIRTLYTICKHQGVVMISYYDIRAAGNAIEALQNKPLMFRKLYIHYWIPKNGDNQWALAVSNLDSSISNDELHKIFGVYGDIKQIRAFPHGVYPRFIEFYDIRAAEAALRALNRIDIAGKQIKLEPSNLGDIRLSLMQRTELDEDNAQRPFDQLLSGRDATFTPLFNASCCIVGGSTEVKSSAVPLVVSAVNDSDLSSSVSKSTSSLATVASIGEQVGLHELHRHAFEVKNVSQCIPTFHPHALPIYHDVLANGSPYGSLSSIRDITCNGGGPIVTEVFGFSGKPHGQHYMWNGSSSTHQHSSSPMIWSNSPLSANGAQCNQFQHMNGFHKANPLMQNTTSSFHHHIGSAPAVIPSLLDKQHNFHVSSLGNGGFPIGSPSSHPVDIASHNISSHLGGSYTQMNKNAALHSPQQMFHIFPGRNPMLSASGSFDPCHERVRNFSHRRSELNSDHVDNKQYELNIDCILRGGDCRTTLMIKNIPNKYTSKMLLATIDEQCRGTYDFLYLPIDFKNKCNVGYAFINMIEPQQIVTFYQAFNSKKWEKFNSEKVATLAYARIQGKAALIAHFQHSSLMNEDKRCRPILFHTNGPNAGDPEPFPIGTNIRSRHGKLRTMGNCEKHNQGIPQSPVNGDGSSKSVQSIFGF